MSHWDKSVKDRREFLNSAVSIGVSTVLGAPRGQFRWDESGEPNQQNNESGLLAQRYGKNGKTGTGKSSAADTKEEHAGRGDESR